MSRPDDIRLRDLARPEHSAHAKTILRAIDELPFELSRTAIVEAARAECDVPLYEEAGLFDRMDEYLEAVEADVGLARMGRFGIYNSLKRYLIQRSRLEALYREHPEIDDVEIDRPLIIAGLPRSGTTHLLNLIGTDTRLRSLSWWESQQPIPSVRARAGEVPDDRRANEELALGQRHLMLPLFRSMYDVGNDDIHEEVDLQHLNLSTLLMASTAHVTDWMRRYFERDQRPHYAFLKRTLKALQWLSPRDRWVLKSPQHLAFIPALTETFQDATIVVTHRDPVSVFASWITMICYAERMLRDPIRLDESVAHAGALQRHLLDGLVRDRAALPEGRTEHVYFHDFMADDLGTLERIYDRAGLDWTGGTAESMRNYIETHPRGRHGRMIYDLKGDFGIDPEGVYDSFEAYMRVFPVEREGTNR